MRKILAATVIGIMFIFGIGSNLVLAETESGNFEKAGQETLMKAEGKLKAIIQEIDDCLPKIPEDGVVDYRELLNLSNKIDKFDAVKADVDTSLGIYALATNTVLDPVLRKAVHHTDGYFSHDIWNRDKDNKVRIFFAKLSGKDLLVESKYHFMPLRICLGVFFLSLLIAIGKPTPILLVIVITSLALSLVFAVLSFM